MRALAVIAILGGTVLALYLLGVVGIELRGPRRGWKDCCVCKGGRMHDRGMASECDCCGEVTSP